MHIHNLFFHILVYMIVLSIFSLYVQLCCSCSVYVLSIEAH